MNNKRRVVVTGVGALTPLAVGVEESWRALCAGKSGIGPVTRFDASRLKCQVAGEVKDFHPDDFISDAKLVRRLDRYIQFAVAASRMALEDSGLKIDTSSEDRVGVVMGAAIPAPASFEIAHELLMKGELERVSPFLTVNLCINMGAGVAAMQLGAKGPQHGLGEACATGTNAIGLGLRLIQHGEADAVIAGGCDAGITPTLFASLAVLGATTRYNEVPQRASRPFDLKRDGFISSEGGAVVILEEMEQALRRGVRIYGEVIGYGNNGDAYHLTSPTPDGEGPTRCMRLALKDAGLLPHEVDYINAHGTSTVANDVAETKAIKRVYGEHARRLLVSANKSMIGHMWGAAGVIEAIFSLFSIRDGIIPPTINYDHPDPECDLDYVPNVARQARVQVAMSNSFGFGGINGCLILKEFRER